MFAGVDAIVGAPQIQFSGLIADTTPRVQPGNFITAVDNWWGAGEFIYARASASIRAFGLCTLAPTFDSTLNSYRFDAAELAATANQGCMVCVAQAAMSSGTYGWFMLSGVTPVNSSAAVAAGSSIGVAATGQGGAVAAGKQILNAKVVGIPATTVTKAGCIANAGSLLLTVPNSDGWFVGAYLSGAGIAAGTTVVGIDPSGRTVTLSAVTTAAVTGSVTATYNNGTIYYNVTHLNRPFAQGAIT